MQHHDVYFIAAGFVFYFRTGVWLFSELTTRVTQMGITTMPVSLVCNGCTARLRVCFLETKFLAGTESCNVLE